jgi:hypothetical protein
MRGILTKVLRDARWIDHERVAGYARIVLAAELAFLAYGHATTWRQGTDLVAFWSAGRLAVHGHAAAAYDFAAVAADQAAQGFPDVSPFLNPPPFLALAAPLGWLSYPAALVVWTLATYAAYALAIRWLPRVAYWPALAFPGVVLSAMAGQNGLLTTALLAGSIGLLPRRQLAAGALMGLMVIKPQLALLAPVAFAAGREWKAFAAAAVTAAAAAGLSLWLFGWKTFQAFIAGTEVGGSLFARPELGGKIKTIYALALQSGAPGWMAIVVQALAAALAAAAVWRVWRRNREPLARAAVLAAATPLATPYLLLYDVVFLVLPIVWLGAEGLRRGFRPGERIVLGVIYVLPVLALVAPFAPIVPTLSLGLVLAVLQRQQARGPSIQVPESL